MFGVFKKSVKASDVAKRLTQHVTSLEACEKMSGMMRPCPVPDGVLLTEIACLRASALCHAIDLRAKNERIRNGMKMLVKMTLAASFEGEEEDGPPDVLDHYGLRAGSDVGGMSEVIVDIMRLYDSENHLPMLTCSLFQSRVRGPGMMHIEVFRLVDSIVKTCDLAIGGVRLTIK